jgi:hypothetical protein
MKNQKYHDFEERLKKFKEKESRGFCYDIAADLVKKGNVVDGSLLILFTWNFAARETKDPLLKSRIEKFFRENNKLINSFNGEDIVKSNLSALREKIIRVFNSLKEITGQTGASKILSILYPNFFVMWDTQIRSELRQNGFKGIGNGETGEKYYLFLQFIQKEIQDNDLHIIHKKYLNGKPIAKAIDEYNYSKSVLR